MRKAEVRDKICLTFVKPKVIPPFHGNIITKPHVCHLMSYGISKRCVSLSGLLFSEDIEIIECNTSWVFHCSKVKFWYKK